MPTIHVELAPQTKIHLSQGDTVQFETDQECMVEFDNKNVFGVTSARTTNMQLAETVKVAHGKTHVTMKATATGTSNRTVGNPIEIVVP
jgi:hypothetical protein